METRNRRAEMVLVVISLIGAARPAQAQTTPAVEVGGNVNGVLSWITGGVPAVGVRVGVPLSPRVTFEAGMTFGRWERDKLDGYGVQIKHMPGTFERATVRPFLTYGLAGVYAQYRESAYRSAKTGALVPEHRETIILPPILGLFGGGIERTLTRHLTARAEAQVVSAFVVPVGMRVTAGLSIPLGGATSPSRGHAAKGRDSGPAAQ